MGKSIYVIMVETLPDHGQAGAGPMPLTYCMNIKTASKAVKMLNDENEKFGQIYDFEEIQSIENYLGLEEVK